MIKSYKINLIGGNMIYKNNKKNFKFNKNNTYVVIDFDKTITSYESTDSWAASANPSIVDSRLMKEMDKLYEKYRPIEIDYRISKEEKLKALFYQHDYSISLKTSNSPKTNDTIMVEDFFDSEAYKPKVDWANLSNKKSHKDFRSFKENMASTIKSYIESNYNSFKDEWFDGFKPVLDQLISVFQL